jgi:hypothetical protein
VRRNRKERMKSVHSANRTKIIKANKNPQNMGLKYTTSRVMPKIYGPFDNSLKTKSNNLGRNKIMGIINLLETFDHTYINEIHTKDNLAGCSSYGPLLNKKLNNHKGSFIEMNNDKLQMGGNEVTLDHNEINIKDKIEKPTLSSNHKNGSGFSGQNTTGSDKASDQDRVLKLEQGASEYFVSLSKAKPNTLNTPVNDKYKRGQSYDNRRGRQSRNMERKKKETSLVNTHDQSDNSKNTENQKNTANNAKNQVPTLHHNSSKNLVQRTISQRFLEDSNADEGYRSKQNYKKKHSDNDCIDTLGLEKQYSKTYIKNSYQVPRILITNSKQLNDNNKNKKTSKLKTSKLSDKN